MERCIRMDMARVLVEVDLTKTLPNKISFQSRDGVPIFVSINYLWLPPGCSPALDGGITQATVSQ